MDVIVCCTKLYAALKAAHREPLGKATSILTLFLNQNTRKQKRCFSYFYIFSKISSYVLILDVFNLKINLFLVSVTSNQMEETDKDGGGVGWGWP